MVVYNRRKRKSYFAEQHILLQQRLAEAREAAARGTADEDQLLLLNRERAAEEAEATRKAKKGLWKSIKGIFSTEGLKQEDTNPLSVLGEEGLRKMSEGSPILEQVIQEEAHHEESKRGGIVASVEEKRREGERELQKTGIEGGPLDRMADQAAEATKSRGGWTSWVTSK